MRDDLAGMLLTLLFFPVAVFSAPGTSKEITVRTESYPRPPYSGATYYFYEQGHQVICTKQAVCNKFDECDINYQKGRFIDPQDVDAFEKTPPILIPTPKLNKHKCLTKFEFIK